MIFCENSISFTVKKNKRRKNELQIYYFLFNKERSGKRAGKMKGDRSSLKNIYSIPSWAMFPSDHQALASSYFSKYIFKILHKVYKLFALYNRETALIPVLNPSSPNAVLSRDSLNNTNTNSSKLIMRNTKLGILKMTSFCQV